MINIKTVASLAGVSPSTVSRVISGNSYVKKETKQRVLEVIKETGYSPNVLAKSLKDRRTNTICLLMPSIQNLVFPIVTQGVEDTARKHGFTVMLCNTNEDSQVENAYIEKMRNRWTDGFILCGLTKNETKIATDLHDDEIPLVLVLRFNPQDVGIFNIVCIDNYASTYSAVEYLIKTGHRRIGFAGGTENLWFYDERFRGYKQALADHDIPFDNDLIMRETNGNDCFYKLTQDLIREHNDIDAICCSTDQKAFVVLRALHDMKVKIPEEISVTGFDNIPLSSIMEPPLTTVSQPLYQMGVAAATNLIKQIMYKEKHGTLPAPVHDVKTTELIVRKSTVI